MAQKIKLAVILFFLLISLDFQAKAGVTIAVSKDKNLAVHVLETEVLDSPRYRDERFGDQQRPTSAFRFLVFGRGELAFFDETTRKLEVLCRIPQTNYALPKELQFANYQPRKIRVFDGQILVMLSGAIMSIPLDACLDFPSTLRVGGFPFGAKEQLKVHPYLYLDGTLCDFEVQDNTLFVLHCNGLIESFCLLDGCQYGKKMASNQLFVPLTKWDNGFQWIEPFLKLAFVGGKSLIYGHVSLDKDDNKFRIIEFEPYTLTKLEVTETDCPRLWSQGPTKSALGHSFRDDVTKYFIGKEIFGVTSFEILDGKCLNHSNREFLKTSHTPRASYPSQNGFQDGLIFDPPEIKDLHSEKSKKLEYDRPPNTSCLDDWWSFSFNGRDLIVSCQHIGWGGEKLRGFIHIQRDFVRP